MDYPQQQAPNLLGSIQTGFQLGQQARTNNLANLAAEQELNHKQELNTLYKLASAGHPEAVQRLAMVAPQAYKGLQDYQNYQVQKGAQLANGIKAAPLSQRPAQWQKAIQDFTSEFGRAPNIASEWSPEAEKDLDTIIARARDVEKVATENIEAPKREAELKNLNARTATEGYQQKQIGANITKTGLESEKLNQEIQGIQAERQGMQQAGITSPTAYKKYQETMAENTAKSQISLPKVEAQANNAIKLIDDIVSHKGMSSVVGAKNILSGAATQYVPFVKKSIPGTQAANFEAKLSQLQGQNFLQAFEVLKGGGAISEIEGTKATQAISDMSTAQSETEFRKSAEELKAIIKTGVARAKAQGGLIPQQSQTPQMSSFQEGQTATNPTTGQTLTFTGGKWQ